MNVFYCFCDCIYAAARAWLALLLADGIFERKRTKERFYKGQGLIIAFVLLIQFINNNFRYRIFSDGILLIMIITAAAGSTFLYKCRFRYSLCLNLLNWAGLALLDFFIQICVRSAFQLLKVPADFLILPGLYRGIYLLTWVFLLVPAGFFLRRWFLTRRTEICGYWKEGGVLAFLLLLGMFYFQRAYFQAGADKLFGRFGMFFVCLALLLSLFAWKAIRQRQEEEKQLHRQEIQMLEKGYEQVLKGYREKSILMHDVRNHLRTIQTMLSENSKEECQSYIAQLAGEMPKKWSMVWTNHKILDLVLNMKFHEAEAAQIKVRCQSDDLSGLVLDSVEICALFANLLDNAVEANVRCPEGMERKIELQCKKQGSILIVAVSNPVPDSSQAAEGLFRTEKQDKNLHGFGMFSIERVLRHHGGNLKAEVLQNWLKILVYLDGFGG